MSTPDKRTALDGTPRAVSHVGRDSQLRRLFVETDGQDLVEYALLASLIAMVAFAAVSEVGNTINTVFWSAIASANV